MSPRIALTVPLVLGLVLTASAFGDDAADLRNADLRIAAPTAADLQPALGALLARGEAASWVTYTVPQVPGSRQLCCACDGTGPCELEGAGGSSLVTHDDTPAGRRLRVLLRRDAGRVDRLRAVSTGCPLDFGGLAVQVWGAVEARSSLALLESLLGSGPRRLEEGALFAAAYHAGERAGALLERVARGELAPRRSEEAVFWLGEARGAPGFAALERLRRDLEDGDVREQIAFALHLSDAPGALEALIDMARSDPYRDSRSQALFWLSQLAGEEATAAIADAIDEDPELEVKRQAIFALSQLPPERGVPLLLRYAETHAEAGVREQAMFWLGQSEDPRAVDFFERILSR